MSYEIILCWVLVYKAVNWKMILVILNESQMQKQNLFLNSQVHPHKMFCTFGLLYGKKTRSGNENNKRSEKINVLRFFVASHVWFSCVNLLLFFLQKYDQKSWRKCIKTCHVLTCKCTV